MATKNTAATLYRTLLAALALAAFMPLSHALTDISDKPIAGTITVDVKPNIMLLMDTSQSMAFSHMPDEVEDGIATKLPIGYKNFQCNSIYYNPNTTYTLPKGADGLNLPTPNFNAARVNYYSSDTTTVDLSTSFQAYNLSSRFLQPTVANDPSYSDTPQAAYYFLYIGSETLNYKTAPCTQPDFSSPGTASDITTTGGGTWRRVLVGSSERQNFANWYTYYRTRMLMTKSSLGQAFAPITSRFRVGFISANPGKPVAADKYLAIADFTTANKAAWYSKVNSQVPNGSSPMREGLARVGRHYANKHDGINQGMDGDPVQYACQKNFTLMTTDGYWNTAAETDGPVQLNGSTKVGQQDGTFTGDSGYTPYGVWDGGSTSTRVTTNKSNAYTTAACVGGYVNKSTAQITKTNTTVTKTTQQNLQTTQQNLQTTSQLTKSTTQTLREIFHTSKVDSQLQATVKEVRRSTVQNLENTEQWFLSTVTTTQTQTQLTRTTTQNLESTAQTTKTTAQTLQSQTRLDQTTSQTFATVTQNLQTTAQVLQSTSQVTKSTSQAMQSTARLDKTVTSVSQSTSQLISYNGTTEIATPVATCTPTGTVSCYTVTTGPTLVASCTPATAAAGNNFTATTCTTTVVSATAPAQTCTAAAPTSANSFQTTTCTAVNTGPTAVASCTPSTATSANSWTTTTCTSNTTGPTPVASCAPATGTSPTFINTTCGSNNTGPTAVSSCTASGATSPNFITTTCTNSSSGAVGVQTCTASGPTSANNWTTTTCSNGNSGPTAVSSCTPQTAGSGNNWLGRTCSTTSNTVAVASCTPQTAASGNSFTTITCATTTLSSNVAVASCTAATPTSANGFVTTTCTPNNTSTFVAPGTCVASGPTSANSFTTTTCNTATTTNVPVASCTANPGTSSPFLVRTCPAPVVTGPTAVATCTNATAAAGNNFTTTTCTNPVVSGPTVMACTVGSTTNASGLTTTCTSNTVTNAVLANSCVLGTTVSGGVTTTCSRTIVTNNPVLSCTANAGTTSPFIIRTCPAPIVTGPTLVDTCTAATAAAGNAFTTTTCATTTVSGPTAVATCTAGTNTTTHQTTTCATVTTATTNPIDPSLCVASGPTAGNGFTTTVCNKVVDTASAGVQTCTPVAPTSANGWKTTTCTPNPTGPTAVSSCTASAGTSSNSWVTTTCTNTILTGPVGVNSCSSSSASSSNGFIATTCSTNNTSNVPVASCTASGKTSANGFTQTSCSTNNSGPTAVDPTTCTAATASSANAFTTTTCTTTTTNTLVASCTPALPNVSPFIETTCSTNATGPLLMAASACSPTGANSGNAFTSITCTPIPGSKFQFTTTTSVLTQYLSGNTIVTNPPAAPAVVTTTNPADVDGVCYTPGVAPPIPALPTTQPSPTAFNASCSAWPCVVDSPNVAGGSNNSLADVAQYYYVNDLRPELADATDITASSPLDDHAPWQHMTTFALGLGVSGTLNYQSDYLTASTGDFSRIRPPVVVPPAIPPTATLNWPAWPDPAVDYADPRKYNDPRSIDDFWHAAVNGRGQYFSASNPAAVVDGLGAALSRIDSESGSGAAIGVSSDNPTTGNNTSFKTGFKTKEWSGELTAQKVDISTGTLSTTIDWSAQAKLDAVTGAACDNRTIYVRSDITTNHLSNFTWNTRGCSNGSPTGTANTGLDATQQALFGSTAVQKLSQFAAMTDGSSGTVNQRSLAAGANLVNFIRGQRGLEVTTDAFIPNNANTLYRKRAHVLGDIVGSAPVYVPAPGRSYADTGYDAFKTAQASRTPMVYVGANDGMLHAIYSPIDSTDPNFTNAGAEAWAYIPTTVLPELYRLADTDYKANHHYFVDATPSTGDVYDSTAAAWKTILVGGLNAGGKGYYALDITNPTAPVSLWEFNQSSTCYDGTNPSTASSDCHIGLTFGRPVITKLVDGTWVVLVTSGYNNVRTPSSTGDGHGYLYVLNAITGKIITKLDTGVGNDTFPSGLREVNNYVANGALDNTTLRVYAGDLLGNIWRFDVNDNLAPSGKEATLVATAKDSGGTAQPITTRLQLAEVDGKTMIVAATGQLLGATDTSTTQAQSVYGFSDLLGSTVQYTDLRGSLRNMTLTASAPLIRTVACTGGNTNCALTSGWVVDLPESGERVNVDPIIVAGTLVFDSNVPSNSACQAGGHSNRNTLNLISGAAAGPDGVASHFLSDSLSVGLSYFVLPDGRVIGTTVGSDGSINQREIPVEPPNPLGRRVSWREIKK